MQFSGSLVAIVTPMHPDGSLDLPALRKLLDWHIDAGTSGIVIVGTTGESPTVDVDEHCTLIKTTVDHVAKRIKVIAGTGANSTSEAIELTRFALEVGADACLSVAPYYNKPTQDGLYRHFRAIAEAVELPLILYNVPGRTVSDIGADTVLRLTQVAGIVGQGPHARVLLSCFDYLVLDSSKQGARTGQSEVGGHRRGPGRLSQSDMRTVTLQQFVVSSRDKGNVGELRQQALAVGLRGSDHPLLIMVALTKRILSLQPAQESGHLGGRCTRRRKRSLQLCPKLIGGL